MYKGPTTLPVSGGGVAGYSSPPENLLWSGVAPGQRREDGGGGVYWYYNKYKTNPLISDLTFDVSPFSSVPSAPQP